MDKLNDTELNQVGWSEDILNESDQLYDAAVSLSKTIGLEIFMKIMAEENGDTEQAKPRSDLIDRLENQLRRIVNLRIKQRRN